MLIRLPLNSIDKYTIKFEFKTSYATALIPSESVHYIAEREEGSDKSALIPGTVSVQRMEEEDVLLSLISYGPETREWVRGVGRRGSG